MERLSDQERAKMFYDKLEMTVEYWKIYHKLVYMENIETLHECRDWDGLLIDSQCPEFESCTCFSGDSNGK